MLAKRTLVLALAVVLIAGLAVYAQTERKNKPAGAPASDAPDITGIGDFFRIDPANRQEWFYKMVDLKRHLMPPGPKEMLRLANLLGLTEEQKQSIKPLYAQFRNAVKPILDQRALATKEFYGILQGTSPSKDALLAAAAKVQQYDQQIISAELDFWLGLRQILNPQQQQSLAQFLQQRQQMEMPGMGDRPQKLGTGETQRGIRPNKPAPN